MTRVHHKMLEQLPFCFPVVFSLVLFYTDTVRGEIGVNCGSGAVIGQPYKLQCTNIPVTTSGINVFLEGVSNSIITCTATKNCIPRDSSLYSVVSPHNESLHFTLLNVTTDDVDKKVYCVDSATLDHSQPSCTIAPPTTIESTTTSMNDVTDGLSVGVKIAIGISVAVGICIIIIVICVCWKKKCYCFAACGCAFPCDKDSKKPQQQETGQEGTALQENLQDTDKKN